MIKIKLTIDYPKEWILRQTPNGDGIWGEYKFYVNEDIEECDYWIVFSKGIQHKETCKVPENHVILIIGEPSTVYHFSEGYLNNFSLVVSCDTEIKHKNVYFDHPYMPWWVGICNSHVKRVTDKNINEINNNNELESDCLKITLKYSDFVKNISNNKSKLLSVITSDKVITKGHYDRLRFVKQLKEYFGDDIDVFGRGFNDIPDKYNAIKDYKYHIVIENSSSKYYWTEKLADAFLCGAYPIYFGCNNLEEYFDKSSFSYIDIYDIKKSIEIIENLIANDQYALSNDFIYHSKQSIINTYNIFPGIIKYCNLCPIESATSQISIKNDKMYIDLYKIIMIIKRFYSIALGRIFNF